MKTLEEIIGQAIGEASMCWSEIPKGIFDSSNASRITKETILSIRQRIKEEMLTRKALTICSHGEISYCDSCIEQNNAIWNYNQAISDMEKRIEEL